VNDEQITFPEIFEGRLQLWPVRVLAGCLVGEHLVKLHTLKLAISILIKGADPAVPHALLMPFGRCHRDFLGVSI
jgi:hypothetical protein